jgi:uncharacterized caspase-like protein
MLRAAVIVLLITLIPAHARAEGRVALLIGNGAYLRVQALPNPPRDAAAMAGLLRKAGFDVVEKTNLGADAMRRALRDFSDRARDADVAVVFYAGHGMEVNGINYLIPVDAVLERDIDVEDETVSLNRVNQVLEGTRRLKLVILDACRDNPFVRSMKRTLAGRSIGRGLAQIDVVSPDTLIAYAAKAGSTAADGDKSNSPYTVALIEHLTTPGLDVRLALGRVRDEVLRSTGNRQEPFVYGSLGGAELPLVSTAVSSQPPAQGRLSEAAEAWDRTKDTTNVAVLEAFVARFRNTFLAELARVRIDELKKQQAAGTEPSRWERLKSSTSPAPPPLASEIEEAIKQNGGKLGEINVTLRWRGGADLDLSVSCPSGEWIDYIRRSACGGELDVEMNYKGRRSYTPIENIVFPQGKARKGTYAVRVSHRGYNNVEVGPEPVDYEVVVRIRGQETRRTGRITQTAPPQSVTSFEVD